MVTVYTQVFVNGEEWYTEEGEWLNDDGTKYTTIGGHTCYVAAFIDGECRTMKEKPIQFLGAGPAHTLSQPVRPGIINK